MPRIPLLATLLFTTFAFAQTTLVATPTARTLVRTGHLVNVHTGAEPTGMTIIVTGDKITAIAPTAQTPTQPGDRELDLSKYTVLPGLFDVHTHLTMATNFDPYWELSMTPGKEAIIGVENAKTTLEAGFTTVRNVGANDYTDVALRDEINAGRIPGPHMQVSGPALGITGGHMDENLLPFEYNITGQGVADGIPAVQQKVRQNIKYGADLIKIGASGGVLSKGDDPQASQYTLEEMQAICADAHRLGRKVAAHAHGAQAIALATQAGVDSIEHGSYVNEEDIKLMKQHGTYLVPTAYLIDWMRKYGNLPAIYQQKMIDVGNAMKENHKKAIQAGVKVALGTDAAVYPHGLNAHEFEVYVHDYGMSPLAALQSGTLNAADLMGWSDKAGALEPGKWADVIAVEGDPLKDIKLLQHVNFVMKSGVVYKDESTPTAVEKLPPPVASIKPPNPSRGAHILSTPAYLKASPLEFRFRLILHAVIYGLGFWSPWNYLLHTDATGPNAHVWGVLSATLAKNGILNIGAAFDLLLALGILCAVLGAALRTWGTAYLTSGVVYDGKMQAPK